MFINDVSMVCTILLDLKEAHATIYTTLFSLADGKLIHFFQHLRITVKFYSQFLSQRVWEINMRKPTYKYMNIQVVTIKVKKQEFS